MSKLSHSHPDHDGVLGFCEHCGCSLYTSDVNAEAYELCGDLVCHECAEEVFEDNGQFGVGA